MEEKYDFSADDPFGKGMYVAGSLITIDFTFRCQHFDGLFFEEYHDQI